jgi:hypothetical protein
LVLASHAAPDSVIAAAIDLDVTRMREFFAEDLEHGRLLMRVNVIHRLWEKAESGNITAILFWARRLGLGRRR